jgi:eukaryotic-like serine/threonine-protein kinase
MHLTQTTWDELSLLLDEALELPPGAREAWLRHLEGARPQLVPALQKLLAAHADSERADPLSSLPRIDPIREGDTLLSDRVSGDRVGPYLLLRIIGGGGMADVWLARRADGAFNREVALKLPLISGSRRELAARFTRERDILATLEHPNIARLYDAGVSTDGLPYLAMEYVDGKPLSTWCDEQRLGVEQRLRLFGQVLAAVQFAHASLVIHRDLKPSNILVTAGGEVRLLDFGIAKLLAADERAHETVLTRLAGRALTPAYASPEQIQGEPLTIASDVYSLGVVLFELLTGTRPYRLKTASAAQLEASIVSAEPLRPSAAVTKEAAAAQGLPVKRLSRRLAGDLDTILLRALAKTPPQRYPTVAALGEDLERHLDGQPVLAQPPSPLYRLGKLVRRHWWPVLAGSTAVVALLVVTGVAVSQARRATAQQRVALAEAHKAMAAREFLIEILGVADPAGSAVTPAREVTVQQAVDLAAERIGPRLESEPEVKMAVLDTLASVYSSLDQSAKAVALLQQALALSERHDGTPHANQAMLLVEIANTEMFAGQFDETRQWLERAEAILAAVGDQSSRYYAQALKIRGNLERRGPKPNFAKATQLLERAVALFRERYPRDEGRLGTLFYLAQTFRSTGDVDRAEQVADEAVAICQRSERASFDIPNAHSLRAAIRENNGSLRGAVADFTEADAGYRRGAGPMHFLTLQNAGLLGTALLEVGERERGMQLVEESTQALGRIRPESNSFAFALARLGSAELKVGSYQRARPALEEARALFERRHEDLQRTAVTVELAAVEAARGRYSRARDLLNEALSVRWRAERSAMLSVAEVQLALGLLALEQQQALEARSQLLLALAGSTGSSRADLTRQVLAQAALSQLAQAQGDAPGAAVAAERALAAARLPRVQELPRVRAVALEAKGTGLCRAGNPAAGEPLLAEAEAATVPLLDPSSPLLARTRLARAACLIDVGRVAEARALTELAAASLVSDEPMAPHFLRPLREVQARLQTARRP